MFGPFPSERLKKHLAELISKNEKKRPIYQYRKSFIGSWEVGYYDNNKNWIPESEWWAEGEAERRLNILNNISLPLCNEINKVYLYRKNLNNKWEVGYYDNDKNWVIDCTRKDETSAMNRARLLNKIAFQWAMDIQKQKDSDVKTSTDPEQVNHPSHYNSYPIEVIDMMIGIWGKEATKLFCEMNAFKYRMRLGLKDDMEQDLKKEQWYLNKAKEL